MSLALLLPSQQEEGKVARWRDEPCDTQFNVTLSQDPTLVSGSHPGSLLLVTPHPCPWGLVVNIILHHQPKTGWSWPSRAGFPNDTGSPKAAELPANLTTDGQGLSIPWLCAGPYMLIPACENLLYPLVLNLNTTSSRLV